MVTDELPESPRGARVYLRIDGQPRAYACACGVESHDLNAALDCGMLGDVRKSRGMATEAVAREIGDISAQSVFSWGQGKVRPQGLYRRALENWLDRGAIPVSAEPATASGGENQP